MTDETKKNLDDELRKLAETAKTVLRRRGIDVDNMSPSELKALAAKLKKGET